MSRGIGETALMAIILTVVGGLVVAVLVGNIVIKGKERVNIEACRANVVTATQGKQLLAITKCHTKPVGQLEFSGKDSKYEHEISKQISDLYQECKYQFGDVEGVPWPGDPFAEGENICFVCSIFSLPEDGSPLSDDTLIQWMKDNKLRSGESYYRYILPRIPGEDEDLFLIDTYNLADNAVQLSGSFNPNIQYAVIHSGFPTTRASQISGRGGWIFDEDVESGTNWLFATRLNELHKACRIT